jgi:hypothetical protein
LGQREVSERRATPVIELGFGIVRGLAAIEEIKEGESGSQFNRLWMVQCSEATSG